VTGFDEFMVLNLKMQQNTNYELLFPGVAIAFVLKGEIKANWEQGSMNVQEHFAYMITPDQKVNFSALSESSVFICTCKFD
jgi:hypothetical protein